MPELSTYPPSYALFRIVATATWVYNGRTIKVLRKEIEWR